jgi:hypothetical protein
MLGKLLKIGAVAAIIMIPTALSAQMGGAANPSVHVGGAVNPGATVRGAVERGIPGPDLGTWRSPSGDSPAPAVGPGIGAGVSAMGRKFGIVSKRLGSPYVSGRSRHWIKSKNAAAPAVKREAEEDWGRRR